MDFVEETTVISAAEMQNLEKAALQMRRDALRDLGEGWHSWTWRRTRLNFALDAHDFGTKGPAAVNGLDFREKIHRRRDLQWAQSGGVDTPSQTQGGATQ